MKRNMSKKHEIDLNQLMIDLGYLNTIQIYKKHGIDIQTQEAIKKRIIKKFSDLCKKSVPDFAG